jgi:hypothetical protein
MNLNFSLFAEAAVFLAFIWFTVKMVWPHMLRAIEQRQKSIADGLAAAEQGRKSLLDPPGGGLAQAGARARRGDHRPGGEARSAADRGSARRGQGRGRPREGRGQGRHPA